MLQRRDWLGVEAIKFSELFVRRSGCDGRLYAPGVWCSRTPKTYQAHILGNDGPGVHYFTLSLFL